MLPIPKQTECIEEPVDEVDKLIYEQMRRLILEDNHGSNENHDNNINLHQLNIAKALVKQETEKEGSLKY